MRILHIVSIVAVLVLLGVIVTHAATTTTAVAEEHFMPSVPSVSDLNGSKTACATAGLDSSIVKVPTDAEIESGIPMHRNLSACHDLIPTAKCKDYQDDAHNHLFKIRVMCTEPVSASSALEAVVTCAYRDATNTLMRNVVPCGTLKPLQSNPRTLAVDVPSAFGDLRDVCSKITVLDVQLFTTQTTAAILVEAVTVSQHRKYDDDPESTPTPLAQGLIVPFAVYAAGKDVDPMCGRSSATQCRLRNTGDGGGLVAQRPVGAVLRIPLATLNMEQWMSLPTRVFRGRLTFYDDAKEYPSKLRLVVYSQPAQVRTTDDGASRRTVTEPTMNRLAQFMGKNGAIAFMNKYTNETDDAVAREAAARCCVVDLSLRDQGVGRVYTFFLTLAVGHNDNLETICFDDTTPSPQPLSNVTLDLLPLFPGHTRPELRVLAMRKSYNIGVAYPLFNNAQPIDVPVALGTRMIPLVRQQHTGTVLDLLHIDCREGDVSSTGCSPPSTLQQLCGMAGAIRTGRGVCVHGHFVCTADAARATPSELVMTTLIGREGSLDVQCKISATMATLKIGDTVVNSMPLFTSDVDRVSAGMEIVYHFSVFQGTTRIWASTRIDEKSDRPLEGGLDVRAFPIIQRVVHETSPDVTMQVCKLYTDAAQLTPFTRLQRRDRIPVQVTDVRAMALPLEMLKYVGRKHGIIQVLPHVMMHPTRPVPMKHLTLTVVSHTYLLHIMHLLNTCKYGTATFDHNGELVLAAAGGVKIMLRHPEPESCTATSKWTLLLRVDDHAFPNPRDAILLRGEALDKNTFKPIRLIVTHPGTRAANAKYHGSICVHIEGEKEVRTVAYHFNAQPDKIENVQLHSLGVISAHVDGRALPHLCTDAFLKDDLFQESRINPSLLQQFEEADAMSDSDIQKRSEKYHSLRLTDGPALTK